MKHLMVASLLACGVIGVANAGVIDRAQRADAKQPASTGQQEWSAWGGEVGMRWNNDLLGNLGFSLSAPTDKVATEDYRRHAWFSMRQSGGIAFSVANAALQHFDSGSLQVRGGYVVTLPDGSQIDLRNFRLQVRASNPKVLDIVSGDGKIWMYVDHVMFELADNGQRLAIRAADLRIAPTLARRIGMPQIADWGIGDLALNTEVTIEGSGAEPDRVCTPYPWPGVDVPGVPGAKYQADLFMDSITVQSAGCLSCTGPSGAETGTASFVPSSRLRNNVNDGSQQVTIAGDPLGTSSALYTANVSWKTMFSGNGAPFNNDQHPYLIWNLYRVNADGSIEQIGRSGVKHAFLTVNGNCSDSCHDSHALGRGCDDTYGTGNNDSPSDMGPRSEIIPATNQWGRCGSIFDTNCDGNENSNGNTSWTQRMKIPESKLVHAGGDGVSFLFESWYLAREDINIYNSMATQNVNPQYSSSTWIPTGASNYALGSAIDRWVDPANPGANAMNSEISVGGGHAKIAVKATDLGGGNWRYDYAVMNFDFAVPVTQGSEPNLRVLSNKGFDKFSIPLPAGATPTAMTFDDGDLDSGNDWTAATTNGSLTWTAGAHSLDWGTMYSFSVTVNAAPTAGKGNLHAATTSGINRALYNAATLVPGQ